MLLAPTLGPNLVITRASVGERLRTLGNNLSLLDDASLALAATGPGFFSLDHLIFRRTKERVQK